MKAPKSQGALLVLGGTPPSPTLIASLSERHDPIVAADAGARALIALGIEADAIVGDLDSVDTALVAALGRRASLVHVPSQESNDLEKSLAWLVELGVVLVTVIGAGGAMYDHAINNLSILSRWSAKMSIRIVDDASVGVFVDRSLELATTVGDRISLIPMPAATIATRGLVWNLVDESLSFGLREGASNAAAESLVRIDLRDGRLLVFHYPQLGIAS